MTAPNKKYTMNLNTSSIYRGLKRLRNKLYEAQFLMDKSARMIYGTPLMIESGKTIQYFVLAFTIKGEKLRYLDKAMAHYAVLRTDIDFCLSQNLIHYAKRKPKETGIVTPASYVSTQKVELCKILGKIDDEMIRWRASLAKGKSVADLQF